MCLSSFHPQAYLDHYLLNGGGNGCLACFGLIVDAGECLYDVGEVIELPFVDVCLFGELLEPPRTHAHLRCDDVGREPLLLEIFDAEYPSEM